MRRLWLGFVSSIAVAVTACHDQPDITSPTLRPPRTTSSNWIDFPFAGQRDPYIRGIHYFGGWEANAPDGYDGLEVPELHPWDKIKFPHDSYTSVDREPWAGWIDDAAQESADRNILSMVDAGFDYVIYQQSWSHDKWEDGRYAHATLDSAYRDYAIVNHMRSQYANRLKFAVMWVDGWSDPPKNIEDANCRTGGQFSGCPFWVLHRDSNDVRIPGSASPRRDPSLGYHNWTIDDYLADFDARVRYWFTQYISGNPNYQNVGGRPVIFFWAPQNLLQAQTVFGAAAAPGAMITRVRNIAASYGFDPFLVATHLGEPTQANYIGTAESWGFNAVSSYVERGVTEADTYGYQLLTDRYRDVVWPALLNGTSSNMQMWVPTIAGENGTPWNTGSLARPDRFGTMFEDHIDAATAFAQDNESRTHKNIVTCCWNEWGEGEYMQPNGIYAAMWTPGSALADSHRRSVIRSAGGYAPQYEGRVAGGNFEGIGWGGYPGLATGWAIDPDTPNSQMFLAFFADAPWPNGSLLAYIATTNPRPDVNQVEGVTGIHGFMYQLPAWTCGHQIWVAVIDNAGIEQYNTTLFGSPRTNTC